MNRVGNRTFNVGADNQITELLSPGIAAWRSKQLNSATLQDQAIQQALSTANLEKLQAAQGIKTGSGGQTYAQQEAAIKKALEKLTGPLTGSKATGASSTPPFEKYLTALEQAQTENVGEFARALETGKGNLNQLSAAAAKSVATYEKLNEAQQQATAIAEQRAGYFGIALSSTTTFLNTKTADALGKLTFGILNNNQAVDKLTSSDIAYLQRQHALALAQEQAAIVAYLASGRFGDALAAVTTHLQTQFAEASAHVVLALLGMAPGLEAATSQAAALAKSQYLQTIATDHANELIFRAAGLFGDALSARTQRLQALFAEASGHVVYALLGLTGGLQSATAQAAALAVSQYQLTIATDAANERIYRAAGLFGEALDARTQRLQAGQKELVGYLTYRNLGQAGSASPDATQAHQHHQQAMTDAQVQSQRQHELAQSSKSLQLAQLQLTQSQQAGKQTQQQLSQTQVTGTTVQQAATTAVGSGGTAIHQAFTSNAEYLNGPVHSALMLFTENLSNASVALSKMATQGASGFGTSGEGGTLASFVAQKTGTMFEQCVALANQWLTKIGMQPISGNAYQGGISYPGYTSKVGHSPHSGDVLVWAPSAGLIDQYGHVDILEKIGQHAGQKMFETFDSNWNNKGPQSVWHPMSQWADVTGWIPTHQGGMGGGVPSFLKGEPAAGQWGQMKSVAGSAGINPRVLAAISQLESTGGTANTGYYLGFIQPGTSGNWQKQIEGAAATMSNYLHGPRAKGNLETAALMYVMGPNFKWGQNDPPNPVTGQVQTWASGLAYAKREMSLVGGSGLGGGGLGGGGRAVGGGLFERLLGPLANTLGPLPASVEKNVQANRELYRTAIATSKAQVMEAVAAGDFYDAMNNLNQYLTQRFGNAVGKVTKDILTGSGHIQRDANAHAGSATHMYRYQLAVDRATQLVDIKGKDFADGLDAMNNKLQLLTKQGLGQITIAYLNHTKVTEKEIAAAARSVHNTLLLQLATDRATEAIDKAAKNWTGAWAALTDSTTTYVNNALNKVAFDILNHSNSLAKDTIALDRLAFQQNREAAAMAQAQAMIAATTDGLAGLNMIVARAQTNTLFTFLNHLMSARGLPTIPGLTPTHAPPPPPAHHGTVDPQTKEIRRLREDMRTDLKDVNRQLLRIEKVEHNDHLKRHEKLILIEQHERRIAQLENEIHHDESAISAL
jgi:hypothetical protein